MSNARSTYAIKNLGYNNLKSNNLLSKLLRF